MMTAASDSLGQPVDLREPSGWRRSKNQLMTILMWLAFVIVLIPLGFVLVTLVAKGADAISWQFLTNSTIPPNVLPLGVDGMGAAVVGTLEITGFASLLAIPLGVLGAVYLNEYGGKGILARLISFMSSVMTGVPSIVMGLFIYIIWVLHFGYSGMAGSFALACLMLPIVIRSSYEMLRLVPDSLRQGSYALGATKARQRRAAGRGAGRGRDGAADLHHPHGGADQPQPFQRAGHLTAAADLLERAVRLRRCERTRLGRGTHAGRNYVHTDDCGPNHHGPIHPQHALGIPWKSSRIS
jgi:hypothetical protein